MKQIFSKGSKEYKEFTALYKILQKYGRESAEDYWIPPKNIDNSEEADQYWMNVESLIISASDETGIAKKYFPCTSEMEPVPFVKMDCPDIFLNCPWKSDSEIFYCKLNQRCSDSLIFKEGLDIQMMSLRIFLILLYMSSHILTEYFPSG